MTELQAASVDPADLWERCCAETPRKGRSPQGAMAFAVDALTGDAAQGSVESARKMAQERADFWSDQAGKNESRSEHYEVISGQFQKIANALASQPSPAATVDLTNHHNALKCPYCNPKGLQFAEPHEGCSAGNDDDILSRLDDHGLFSKADRMKLFKEAAAEIRRLRVLPQAVAWQPIKAAPDAVQGLATVRSEHWGNVVELAGSQDDGSLILFGHHSLTNEVQQWMAIPPLRDVASSQLSRPQSGSAE